MLQPSKFQKLFTLLMLLLLIELTSVNTLSYIQQYRYTPDGLQNITATINLLNHNTISLDGLYEDNNLVPTNHREPLPIFLNALWVKLHPDLSQLKTLESFKLQKNADKFRLQNVIYTSIILLGVYLLSFTLLINKFGYWKKVFISILTMLATYCCMPFMYVNTMFTEYIAEALIIFFVLYWLKSTRNSGLKNAAFSGVFLGLLLLTKVAFVYIANGILVSLILWMLFVRVEKKKIYQHLIILIIANLLVMPWYVRNYIQFGQWAHSTRGSSVLLARSYYDRMTDDEFKGGFFAYAPVCMKEVMRKVTGFDYKDRITGGRLERLRRYPKGDRELRAKGDEKNAIGYVTKSSTHYANALKDNVARLNDDVLAQRATESEIKHEAKRIISQHLIGHMKTTALFAWRGAWPSNRDDGVWDYRMKPMAAWTQLLPFVGLLSMLSLFVYGIFNKRLEFLSLSALGSAQFAFYALFTHFLPRYSEMFVGLWVVCFMVVIVNFFSKASHAKTMSVEMRKL